MHLGKQAKLEEEQYPRATVFIQSGTHIDDTISGELGPKVCEKSVQELKMVLKTGVFGLRGQSNLNHSYSITIFHKITLH